MPTIRKKCYRGNEAEGESADLASLARPSLRVHEGMRQRPTAQREIRTCYKIIFFTAPR